MEIVEAYKMSTKVVVGRTVEYTARCIIIFELPDTGNDYASFSAIEKQIRDTPMN